MDLLIPSLLLIVGLAGLSFGAEFLIRGAVSTSRLLGISPFIIGLTVIAWGTSAPEVVVSVGAALNGVPDVAVGNVIGSNITNVLLIGGLTALFLPLCCTPQTVRRDGPVLIFATLFVLVLAYWLEFLPRWAGVLLLLAMVVHTLVIFRFGGENEVEDAPDVAWGWGLASLSLFGGLLILIIGGQVFIVGAVALAEAIHVPEAIIGATVVAIGTSLPELFASIAAARQGHRDLVIGNIVGSNLTNIMLVLGLVAFIAPLPVAPELYHSSLVLFGVTSFVFIGLLLAGRSIGRWIGLGFLAAFAAYLYFSLLN
ncbi:MAG: calcium/sodium antiporter [Alphaproteobacteria bacterium TMED89]|nr:sodium:calcium antiporter [Rhodospirillaceae bacterium]RPH18720.1 MAG: calcium/sodium antiporter [Alphaproteobacteria bacterium TMED89]